MTESDGALAPTGGQQDERRTLDLERYFPFLLTQLSNKLSSAASQLYMREFGVGVVEWRVLSGAAAAPGARPNDICYMVGIDKGAVARAIRTLGERGLMTTEPGTEDGRSKTLHITEAGWALHQQVLEVALRREQVLLAPLSPADREKLLHYMRVLIAQLPSMRA